MFLLFSLFKFTYISRFTTLKYKELTSSNNIKIMNVFIMNERKIFIFFKCPFDYSVQSPLNTPPLSEVDEKCRDARYVSREDL